MQQIAVKTPQNVMVNLFSAGIGWRILAFFIDVFIIILYLFGITWLLSKTFNGYDFWGMEHEEYNFLNIYG